MGIGVVVRFGLKVTGWVNQWLFSSKPVVVVSNICTVVNVVDVVVVVVVVVVGASVPLVMK